LPCLQTWSSVGDNICPLCKESFTSIHKLQINLQPIEIKVAPKPKSVKSDPDDFEESDYMDLVTLIELEDMFTCALCQNDHQFEYEDQENELIFCNHCGQKVVHIQCLQSSMEGSATTDILNRFESIRCG